MPLESTIQNFSIVLRDNDFKNLCYAGSFSYMNYYMRVASKWIQLSPSILLNSQRKLFIDSINTIYNINSINQALRLYIRPIVFWNADEDNNFLYTNLLCESSLTNDRTHRPGSIRFMRAILGITATTPTPKELAIYTSSVQGAYSYTMYCCDFNKLNETIKTELGELPSDSIVSSIYIDGKFTKEQPHIEHINSGDYSIYNNLRLIALSADDRINNIDYNNISTGFIANMTFFEPALDTAAKNWSWKYLKFDISMKYIYDIVDLASAYLSYSAPYTRYFVMCLNGEKGWYNDFNTKAIKLTGGNYAYSCFEFFLAPVGEAS